MKVNITAVLAGHERVQKKFFFFFQLEVNDDFYYYHQYHCNHSSSSINERLGRVATIVSTFSFSWVDLDFVVGCNGPKLSFTGGCGGGGARANVADAGMMGAWGTGIAAGLGVSAGSGVGLDSDTKSPQSSSCSSSATSAAVVALDPASDAGLTLTGAELRGGESDTAIVGFKGKGVACTGGVDLNTPAMVGAKGRIGVEGVSGSRNGALVADNGPPPGAATTGDDPGFRTGLGFIADVTEGIILLVPPPLLLIELFRSELLTELFLPKVGLLETGPTIEAAMAAFSAAVSTVLMVNCFLVRLLFGAWSVVAGDRELLPGLSFAIGWGISADALLDLFPARAETRAGENPLSSRFLVGKTIIDDLTPALALLPGIALK